MEDSSSDSVSNKFWELYEQKKETDIVFELKDDDGYSKEFHLHKKILGAASGVFHELFSGTKAEKSKKIIVKDIKAGAFEHVIRYSYKNEVNLEDLEEASKVCYAAKKYKIQPLFDASLRHIYDNICPSNVVSIVENSYTLDTNLNDRAFWLIKENFEEVQKTGSCLRLSSSNFLFLAIHIRNHIKPIDLFQLSHSWSKNACTVDGIEASKENRRARIEPILPYIRFLQLTLQEFVATVLPTEILTSEESGSIGANIDNQGKLTWSLPSWCSRASFMKSSITVDRKTHRLKDGDSHVHYIWSTKFSVSENAILVSIGFDIRWDLKFKEDIVLLKVELKCVEKKEVMFFEVKHTGVKEFFPMKLYLLKPFEIEGHLNSIYELSISRVVTNQNFQVYGKRSEFADNIYQFPCSRSQRKDLQVKFHPTSNASILEIELSVSVPSFLV